MFQRKIFKKRFEFFIFPKISSEESHESDDDDFFPHPNNFPYSSISLEFIGNQSLEEKLQKESDEKYFGDKRKHFYYSVWWFHDRELYN